MKKRKQDSYYLFDKNYQFQSFEEIKDTLNYFEKMYFKNLKFLLFKVLTREKIKEIMINRHFLSQSIFNFILYNYDKIPKEDLIFISNFYLKYFIHNQKKFNLLYYINPINIFDILKTIFSTNIIEHNFYRIETDDIIYFEKYYSFFSLIIFLDNKLLIDSFLYYCPINDYFYYCYIIFYFKIYYKDDYFIKHHYLFDKIILNLDNNIMQEIKRHITLQDYNNLTYLIQLAQEKENLKNNLENF